jgi:quercetin dioxygenase-like cupin family protein
MERISESQKEYRDGDWGVKYLIRGPSIEWGVIRLKPGQNLDGHYHEQVEETFWLLEGSAILSVDGEPHHLVAGDAVRLEAKRRHSISNESDQPMKMAFIKCPYLPKDKVLSS